MKKQLYRSISWLMTVLLLVQNLSLASFAQETERLPETAAAARSVDDSSADDPGNEQTQENHPNDPHEDPQRDLQQSVADAQTQGQAVPPEAAAPAEGVPGAETSAVVTLFLDKGNISLTAERISGYDASGAPIERMLTDLSDIVITQNDTAAETAHRISLQSTSARLIIKDINWRGDGFIDLSSSELMLVLDGSTRAVTSSIEQPIIHVPQNSSLTITGDGALSMESRSRGAKAALIGGKSHSKNGTIRIESGSISAYSRSEGAIIGSGYYSGYGAIEIHGGRLDLRTETDVCLGASIGSGFGNAWHNEPIRITGGDITLQGGWGGAGIGASDFSSSIYHGDISISGGKLHIASGYQVYAIRAKELDILGGTFSINGGNGMACITAQNMRIGDGKFDITVRDHPAFSVAQKLEITQADINIYGSNLWVEDSLINAKEIEILDGKIKATADRMHGYYSSAIGAEYITIRGGSIYAKSAGAGIGNRSVRIPLKSLTLTGGSIYSKGGAGSTADIGSYNSGNGTWVHPTDENGNRVYLKVIENVAENLREQFFVDGKPYPIGKSIDGDHRVYLYLSEGFHRISYGDHVQTLYFGDNAGDKGSVRFHIIDGINGSDISHARVELYRDGVLLHRSNAEASIWLEDGTYQAVISSYGYYRREVTVTIEAGQSKVQEVILNSNQVVETQVTVTPMSREEILQAGIDPDAEGNQHLFRFKVVLEFAAHQPIEFTYIGHGGGAPYHLKPITVQPESGAGFDTIRVQPISERFYLVIYGHSQWLKEMYDVSLVVINNSKFESLQNVVASLDTLPDGLSFADMNEAMQSSTQSIADIAPGKSATVNWYLRGDKEGEYHISGKVTGDMSGGGQSFVNTFETKEPFKVLGGRAMHLYITVEDKTWQGDLYHVSFELVNESDRPVNNISLALDREQQYRITHKNGEQILKEYKASELAGHRVSVEKLMPGESLFIEFETVIEFESELHNNPEYILVDKWLEMLEGSTTRIPHSFRMKKGSFDQKYLSITEFETLVQCLFGDPVDLLTGQFTWEYRDLALMGKHNLEFTRTYRTPLEEPQAQTASEGSEQSEGPDAQNSASLTAGAATEVTGIASNSPTQNIQLTGKTMLGYGWSSNHDYELIIRGGLAILNMPAGERSFFRKEGDRFISAAGSAWNIREEESGYLVDIGRGRTLSFNKNGQIIETDFGGGNKTTYTHDEFGRISTISNRSGSFTLSYNEQGLLSMLTDSAGRSVSYSYDTNGSLIEATNPDQDSFTFTYDQNKLLKTVSDLNGNEYITNTYDAAHRVIHQRVVDMGEFEYSYDDVNRSNSYTQDNGAVVRIEYDDKNRIIKQIDNSGEESYIYNDKHQRISQTDKNGNTTTYEYNEGGYITAVNYPDGSKTVYDYDEKGRIIRSVDGEGGITSLSYNEAGSMTAKTDALGNTLTLVYDANQNLVREEYPDGIARSYAHDERGNVLGFTDANGYTTSYEYDSVGRLTKEIDPTGAATSYAYTSAGKLISTTDALGGITRYTYNPNGYQTAVIDANGSTSTTEYNVMNKVSRKTDETGRQISFAYDTAGNLIRVTNDKTGQSISYEYDLLGQMTKKIDALGGSTLYAYDKNGNRIKEIDELGAITTIEYNSVNLPIKRTDALGNETRYGYDKNGRLIEITDPLGNRAKNEYDANGNLIKTIDKKGNTISYRYDALGRLGAIIDQNGESTSFTYDNNDNILRVTDADTNAVINEYNAQNQLIRQTDKNGNTVSYHYDPLGRKTKETDALGAGTLYTYDAVGNLIRKTDALGGNTDYEYDRAGRLLAITDAKGNTIRYRYEDHGEIGEIIYPDNGRIIKKYDGNANLIEEIDQNGNKRRYQYDAKGRLIQVIHPDNSKISYQYDATDNLTQIMDEVRSSILYAYDANGNRIQETDALGTTTRYSYDQNANLIAIIREKEAREITTSYEYDAKNRLTKEIDAIGNETKYSYDKNDNRIAKSDPNGNIIRYQYDLSGNLLEISDNLGKTSSYRYDAQNRLIQTKDNLGETSYEYDALGQITSVSKAGHEQVQYSYDPVGNLQQIRIGQQTILYEYDNMNRITKISLSEQANAKSIRYGYDAKGNLTLIRKADGSREQRQYDNRDRLTRISQNRQMIAGYQYDGSGNLISSFEKYAGIRTMNGYNYDQGHRLTLQTVVRGNEVQRTSYEYDSQSNLTKESRIDPLGNELSSIRYEYNDLDQMIRKGSISYTYDANGNLIEERQEQTTIAAYRYDSQNKLIWGKTEQGEASYVYDAMSHLVKQEHKTNGQTIETSITPNYIAPIDSALKIRRGNEQLLYLYGANGQDGICKDNKIYSITKDRLGSIRAITDPNGQRIVAHDYDAWGEVSSQIGSGYENSLISEPSYTGHRYDPMLEQYYAKARMYSPNDKRFTSLDPIRDGLNWYEYCRSNPMRYIDPNGEIPTMVIGGIIGFAGGTVDGMISELTDGKKGVNFKNVAVDALSGAGAGMLAGSGVGMITLVTSSFGIGAGNYSLKTTLNKEWGQRSAREHIYRGTETGISYAVSALIGGNSSGTIKQLKDLANTVWDDALDEITMSMRPRILRLNQVLIRNGTERILRDFTRESVLGEIKGTIRSYAMDMLLGELVDYLLKNSNMQYGGIAVQGIPLPKLRQFAGLKGLSEADIRMLEEYFTRWRK